MADESDLEKTEAPSGRRIEQAREQGQVPHSRELSTFLVLIFAAAAFWTMGGWFFRRAAAFTKQGLILDSALAHDPSLILPRLSEISGDALLAFAPLLVLMVLAALLPPFVFNAWVFSTKAMMPDLSRLNPLSGLSRMVSWNSLMDLGKAILKAALVGGVAALLIWRERDEIFGLLGESLETGLAHAGHLLAFSFLVVVCALIVVVAIDVPFQLWQYFDKLKMSKEEVKQEMKEAMGDPQVKGRIRSLQMEAARKRMMAAVPKADVIVTNPTHYAVALSYKSGMAAPRIVAMGVGVLAQKIKAVAAEHAVPTLEAPPLARALYRHGELDKEIPGGLYKAVAEVLAYVYQLSTWRSVGGNYPVPPRDLDVPPELVPEAV